MTDVSALDVAGRRRSPATMPGFHAGRPPRNKGMQYPADPPTVDEIVAVMRHTDDDIHGFRLRAMIVVLWRAGLRIHEALALTEHDLDPRRGSVLVRSGKGGRRREVGMDEWGWEQVRPWLHARIQLPAGPLFCIIDGPTRGTAVVERFGPPRVPAGRGARGHQKAVRAAPAAPRARARARARGRAAEHHPAPTRTHQSRHHLDLPARHRSRGDPRRCPRTPRADDVGQRRATSLKPAQKRECLGAPASPSHERAGPASSDARFPRTETGVSICSSAVLRTLNPCWPTGKATRCSSPRSTPARVAL